MAWPQTDREAFEEAADALQADVTAAATMAVSDGRVRDLYQRTIKNLIDGLRADASSHRITWADAAQQASSARNSTMELLRSQSSPVGRAMAEQLKAQGKTLNELVARYSLKLFGEDAHFDSLSIAEKNRVYAAIVEAAGRSNPRVNVMMATVSHVGRGLVILSIAISVYKVATSDDPWNTAEREVAVTGGGIAGGVAGGALAGLACGPGAPVCVTIGAFVGGTVVALGIDWLW
jgi:hypothetical protein